MACKGHSWWSKCRHSVLGVNTEQKVCGSQSWTYLAVTPWRRLPSNESAGEKENVGLLTTASKTILAAGQIPDWGPEHSEVKAEPRTSSLDCAFLVLCSTSLRRSLTDTPVNNCKPVTSPCTCSQNTKPRHKQPMGQQWTDRTVQKA